MGEMEVVYLLELLLVSHARKLCLVYVGSHCGETTRLHLPCVIVAS